MHHHFLPFFSRFDNHGGGWGYSGHSIEAIRFMVDTGNSLSDQQNIIPINPKYDNRMLYELHVQQIVLNVSRNSKQSYVKLSNNFILYFGLIDE